MYCELDTRIRTKKFPRTHFTGGEHEGMCHFSHQVTITLNVKGLYHFKVGGGTVKNVRVFLLLLFYMYFYLL